MRILILSGRRALHAPVGRRIGTSPWNHRSKVGSSDQAKQALGSVGCFRFFSLVGGTGQGEPRHRSSQRFSALWRHLPGQECAEVCRALTAMVCTGLEEGVQPMVWIEPPKQGGLDNTKKNRRQVGAPHAPRAEIIFAPPPRAGPPPAPGAVIILAAHHRVA